MSKMRKNWVLWGCLLVFCGGLSGCFRSWHMTDRELKRRFANQPQKPIYHTIENDTLQLFVATLGSDTLPPLLLIHGAPGGWYGYVRMFEDTLLLARYQVIAVDRLGYNHSKHKREQFVTSVEMHARAVAMALVFNKSKQKGVLLGRSYGAPIAAKIAVLNPDRFERLILLASAIDPEQEKFWWFSKLAKRWPVRVFLPNKINAATFEKFAHVAELRKLEPDWPQLKLPTVFVQGGKDWIVNPGNLDYARRKMATNHAASFIFLPEAGHLLSNTHSDLVRKLIVEPQTTKLSSAKP